MVILNLASVSRYRGRCDSSIAIFTGLHHAMTPIALQNFANQGYDMLMPMMFMANMAITGATAAIYLKVKSKKKNHWFLSSAVSGLLGITEPALFGILSKYKESVYGDYDR